MLRLLAIVASLLTVCNASTFSYGIYTVYVPKYLRPGFDVTFTVGILNTTHEVEVHSVLHSADEELELSSEDIIPGGSSVSVNLGQIPLDYQGSKEFTLTIVGLDASTGDQVFTNMTDDFIYTTKAISILIQTDKAIYKPGEIMRFRALCLTPDLRPLSGLITYQVQDPDNNIIDLQPNLTLANGVASGELPLHKKAVEGDWTISFMTHGYKAMQPVTVQIYKLPKFEVTVEAPSYITAQSEGYTITVKATYTYGKPVDGTAIVQIEIGNSFPPNLIERTIKGFNGSASVFIPVSEGMVGLPRDHTIKITACVTEALTSITFNDTTKMDFKQTHIKLETLLTPDTIKPGLKYQAYVKVSEQDGKMLMEVDRLSNNVSVELFYKYNNREDYLAEYGGEEMHDVDYLAEYGGEGINTPRRFVPSDLSKREVKTFEIPVNGIVRIMLDAKDDNFASVSMRAYTTATETYERFSNIWAVSRALSPSDSYIQIVTQHGSATDIGQEMTVGSVAHLKITTTEMVSSFKIMIMARGQILDDVTVVGIVNKMHMYSFTITQVMVPSVQVLVSYVRADGEIVADYIKISVALALENQVSIMSSASSVDAGDDVSIQVQTSGAGSYVGLRAIDQSVLLLKSGNDITKERVADDLEEYSVSGKPIGPSPRYIRYPYSSGAKDASQVFQEAGMIVLTNGNLYMAPHERLRPVFPGLEFRGPGFEIDEQVQFLESASATTDRVQPGPSAGSASTPRVRSLFPETWIWDDKITRDDGVATFNVTAPDTITSWVLSAFSMSDEFGLGIADPIKLAVFRNFFISLNLPLKIKRGEIIIVQAIVFNYYQVDLDVQLRLHINDKFLGVILLRPGDDAEASGQIRHLRVPAGGAVSVKYPIQINLFGEVPIRVSATSTLAGDAIVRNVYVRPEGIEQCYSSSVLLERDSDKADTSRETFEIMIPAGAVPGSAHVNLLAYGDLMGNAMSNFGKLLKKPSGCGEQNMITFAPDVFVTLYLQNSGTLDEDTRMKAYQHFTDGYMNELRYKHKDGSYSAFGERDDSGSTWLTAFVAKCFIFARQLRPELVENRIIDDALEFLIQQQREDGSFGEPGRVIHQDMQGRVSSSITMTAYVLITLRETNYAIRNREVQEASNRARMYLESRLNQIMTDQYSLAIVTYALHVAESPLASRALEALEVLAVVTGGFKYWHEAVPGESMYDPSYRPPYQSGLSNDIEMTAYVMLTYVRRTDYDDAGPLVRWLLAQQNELGGYSSTQDTVIAIQAMSKIAELVAHRTHDLDVMATHSNDPTYDLAFTIDETNKRVLMKFDVPPVDGILTVTAEGVGIAVAQLSVCYNTPDTPYVNEPFNCTLSVDSEDNNSAYLEFCCSLNDDDMEATGMFLFEIGLLNGFTVDEFEEEVRNPEAQLVELEDGKVNIYYNQLEPDMERCARVMLLRYSDVAAIKPATVSASEYYSPGKKVNRRYNVDGLAETGPCDVCGYECVGCPAPMLGEFKPWTPCVEFCKPEMSTRGRDCVDPSLNVVLDPEICGITGEDMETRPCQKDFSCPDVQDGLWYDMPSNYMAPYRAHPCSALGRRRSPRTHVPGSAMDGSRSYITCAEPSLVEDLDGDSGFTISFLVNPLSFDPRFPVVFLSIGEERNYPIIMLEKIWWKNGIRLTARLGLIRYTVHSIPLQLLPLRRWSSVVITINPMARTAKVIINGLIVGRMRVVTVGEDSIFDPEHLRFYLGRTTKQSSRRQGYMSGALSNLNFWPRVLPEDEMMAFHDYLNNIVSTRDEPILSVRQLRMFSPDKLETCFKKPSRLSTIYAENKPDCSRSSKPTAGPIPGPFSIDPIQK